MLMSMSNWVIVLGLAWVYLGIIHLFRLKREKHDSQLCCRRRRCGSKSTVKFRAFYLFVYKVPSCQAAEAKQCLSSNERALLAKLVVGCVVDRRRGRRGQRAEKADWATAVRRRKSSAHPAD